MNTLPTVILPSIDFDLDFDGENAACEAQEPFEQFLATLPGLSDAPEHTPQVNYMEDEQAVWLRGTVWLLAYDADLAGIVANRVLHWAERNGYDARVNF